MPSGGTQVQTTTSQVQLTPEQQELLRMMLPGIKDHLEKPPALFPKSQIAGFDPLQLQAQQMALQLVDSKTGALHGMGTATNQSMLQLLQGGPGVEYSPELKAAMNTVMAGQVPKAQIGTVAPTVLPTLSETGVDPTTLAQPFAPDVNNTLKAISLQGPGGAAASNPELAQALSFLMGPVMDVNSNPALRSAMDAAVRPVTEQFNETVLPGIRRGAIQAGQLGGNRQGIAEGIASREFLRQIGDITSKMSSEGYGQGLQAATATANSVNQNLTQELQTLLDNEAKRLGISADVLTKSLSDKLQAESQRFATTTGAATADSQIQAALKQAELDAQTRLQTTAMQQQGETARTGMTDATTNRGLTLDAIIKGITTSPIVGDNLMLPSQVTGAVGDARQGLTQAQLSEEAQRWIAEQTKNFAAIQDVAQLFFGMPGQGTTSTSTSPKPPSNTLQKVTSTAVSTALIYALLKA